MTHRALILDKQEAPGAPDRASEFERLCLDEVGWSVARIPMYLPNMDGKVWLQNLQSEIDDADILICLGDFITLLQAGDELLETLFNRILEKAKDGMPVLIQSAGVPQNLVGQKLIGLLKSFEVQLTDLKVASLTRDYEKHSSDLCIVFSKHDDCLRDRSLFRGIDKVSMSGVHLIEYDGEAVPIIDAVGPSHFIVDSGDLRTRPPLGVRPTPAIIRQTDTELQIIIGGLMLNDPAESLGGTAPSIIDNLHFAKRLVHLIDDHMDASSKLEATAYTVFARLERAMGSIVEAVYPDEQVRITNAPIQARNLLEKPSTGWGRADFRHIYLIIVENWPDFEQLFPGMTADLFLAQCEAINREERKYVAHPHKAKVDQVDIGQVQLDRLRSLYLLTSEAIKRLGRSAI